MFNPAITQGISPMNTTMFNPSLNQQQGGGKNKKQKNGLNQMQIDLIKNLFGQTSATQPFVQSGYMANIQPTFFNFDPSQAFNGINPISAAQNNFNPWDAFGSFSNAGAASIQYDPMSYLNGIKGNAQSVMNNFNPNAYNSQYTQNALNQVGTDTEALRRIREQMQATNKMGLPQLDAQTSQQLQQMLQSQLGQIGLSYDQQNQQALADLFGRGLNKSTIALDQQGRLNYGAGQLRQQAMADNAQQTIGLQQNVRDAYLQNLIAQGGTVRDVINASLQGAGLSQQGDIARMQAALEASSQNASLGTQVNLANQQALMQKFLQANQVGANIASQNAGFQQQANLQNSSQWNDRGNLAAQLLAQVAGQNAGFQQQTNEFNNQQQLGMASQINQLLAQMGLANAGFANEASTNNAQLNQNTSLANLNAMLQQFGQRNDLFNNAINSYFGRKQQNKGFNLQQLQLELERQQQAKQLELQYAQLAQQWALAKKSGGFLGGLGKGLLGGLANLALPGIGGAISNLGFGLFGGV